MGPRGCGLRSKPPGGPGLRAVSWSTGGCFPIAVLLSVDQVQCCENPSAWGKLMAPCPSERAEQWVPISPWASRGVSLRDTQSWLCRQRLYFCLLSAALQRSPSPPAEPGGVSCPSQRPWPLPSSLLLLGGGLCSGTPSPLQRPLLEKQRCAASTEGSWLVLAREDIPSL